MLTNPAPFRRRHAGHRRRQPLAGPDQRGLLGLRRPVRRRHRRHHPAGADRSSASAAGDPLALTVNYCAPIAEGDFDLDVRLVKANRSSQHWCVELTQGGGEVATLATAVFAERRPSWSHQPAQFPEAKPFEQILPYPKIAASWVKQYDFRFVEGDPDFGGSTQDMPASAYLQTMDRRPRAAQDRHAVADVDVGCVLRPRLSCQARAGAVRHGVADDLFPRRRRRSCGRGHPRVLAVADAKIFHKSYGDQNGELWSPNGRLLATTTQIAYFKA